MKIRTNNFSSLYRIFECDLRTIKSCFRAITVPDRLYSDDSRVEAAASLSDLHGRRHNYLRISLTERCNLRCKYCMPAEGVPLSSRSSLLSVEELRVIVGALAAAGVDKLRLTGGEPTLRSDLADIIQSLKAIDGIRSVSMTTNGLVLARRLASLQRAGLDAVNVSLDTLRPDRYEDMARRRGLARVLAGLDLALQLGYSPVKINTVLMRGFNDDEIGDFIEMTRERDLEVSSDRRDATRRQGRARPAPCSHRAADTAPCADPLLVQGGSSRGSRRWSATIVTHLFVSAGVPVRGRGGVAAGRGAGGRGPGAAAAAGARRAAQQEGRARRNAKFGAHGEPAHDSHRRVGDLTSRDGRAFKVQGVGGSGRLQARAYCTGGSRGSGGSEPPARLSHLDAQGRARMVDVSSKPRTQRAAAAECELRVGGRLLRLLRDAAMPKGDALTVAEIAGVLGAKRTSDLIPLCHPLALELVRVRVSLPGGECAAGGAVRVRCEVGAEGRTGVEMEALVGAAVAALALYDMCKAVDKHMSVSELRVVHKSGGSTPRARSPPPPLRAPDTTPLDPKETYAPTDLAHF
uniref:Radical SAM core domain-containing protein n=1 Tax=Bombyx mori TaxID=7091 RepID=A0A8R2R9F3_BOMMO|nr:molybdenum cofactor biosynthesis protein 1 isoform X3 [Bombyx mori]